MQFEAEEPAATLGYDLASQLGKIKVSRRRTFSDVTSRINISSSDLTARSGSVGRENANEATREDGYDTVSRDTFS